jgi:hypothetical protein
MNARPYPEGFFTWDENERNAYFAKAAAAYREKNPVLEVRPPFARPKALDGDSSSGARSPYNHGAIEPPDFLTSQQEPRFRLLAFGDVTPDSSRIYLIKGLLPRAGLAVVWGPPKCGEELLDFRCPHACCARVGISRASCRSWPCRLLRPGESAGLPESD